MFIYQQSNRATKPEQWKNKRKKEWRLRRRRLVCSRKNKREQKKDFDGKVGELNEQAAVRQLSVF